MSEIKEADLVKGFKFESPGMGNFFLTITSRKADSITLTRSDGMIMFTNLRALMDTIGYINRERKLINAKHSKN